MPSYVIVTPAHNEEAFIERTLESVVRQTVRPLQWVIVDDASTDRTPELVERYTTSYPFVQLVKVQRPAGRDFGNKARAFNRGLASVRHPDYQYVGNLDADISLEPDYYERILVEFEKHIRLGIAGGMVWSCIEGKFVSQGVSLDSVAGAVQLFRRTCFEETGGYQPLPQGGIDAAVEIVARKSGWEVRTLPELRVLEHRRTGTATARPVRARVREGKRLHSLGYSFSFFLLRCLYRSMEPPRVLGSAAALYGYLAALLRGEPVVLPADVVQFLRHEQRSKILQTLQRFVHRQS
jgi:biofilm PGA synthesis N-glycosyltransferase PgaC